MQIPCPACEHPNPEGQRFCGGCGALLPSASDSLTRAAPPAYRSGVVGPGAEDAGRFMPGAVLGGRYRMLGLLGRGGMGEVYRADDLKLGQPVALKFLPAEVERDPDRLERFLTEVRLSLKVTHPNVCRVFDVGQIDQRHFLSMEYVDGEDLGSLLRRIGRLPEDKAIEIARQLCAGLTAAHDEGVLHRDIKPANIMIDGRGRAKLTDFGLAGAVAGIAGAEARAGTPQYMAPEQVDGSRLSERTDLYALGLVLYELFTGKRAYEIRSIDDLQRVRSSIPTSPSSHVSGLDPLIERAILRCLEADPAKRPASAAALAAALPGGDPLAMAIAAGDTPSPEMVAAAGADVGIDIRMATVLVGLSIAGIVVLGLLNSRLSIFTIAAPQKPPDVMIEQARSILTAAGLPGHVEDFAWGVMPDLDYLNSTRDAIATGAEAIAQQGVRFWYRQAPVALERWLFLSSYLISTVWPADPGLRFSGEALVVLDRSGRLLELTVMPPEHLPPAATSNEPDWSGLFNAAGLDPAMWTPAQPEWMPQYHSDRQFAWVPRDEPENGTRIEAASFRGRPVSFLRLFPWSRAIRDAGTIRTSGQRIGDSVRVAIFAAVLIGAVLAARRNLTLDRADRSGAVRVGVAIGALTWITWVINEHHVPSIWEMYLVVAGTSWALFAGALVAVFYLALEPYVRRTWPEIIVSWSRLIAGDWRDPLVARDVLIGVAVATMVGSIGAAGLFVAGAMTGTVPWIETSPRAFLGARGLVAQIVAQAFWSVFVGLMYLLVFFALRRLLRREWAAVLGGALLMGLTVSSTIGSTTLVERLPFALLAQAGLFIVLSRVGLVALIAALYVFGMLQDFPVTWPLTPWYSSIGLVGLAVTMALAVAAFRIVRSATAAARA